MSNAPEFPPRLILFNKRMPDWPVEWTNPGRPGTEDDVAYIRMDIVTEQDGREARLLAALHSLVDKGHTQSSGVRWSVRVKQARDLIAELESSASAKQ